MSSEEYVQFIISLYSSFEDYLFITEIVFPILSFAQQNYRYQPDHHGNQRSF